MSKSTHLYLFNNKVKPDLFYGEKWKMRNMAFPLKPMTNLNQLIKAHKNKKGHLVLFPETTDFSVYIY